MKRWEYMVMSVPVDTTLAVYRLNDMGHDGWELVSIDPPSGGWCRATFKRPKA